jgi:hypothetical protein
MNSRKFLNQEITSTYKKFLDEEEVSYDKKYVGKIVDNDDPEKLGRCKVRVYGIFDNVIPDSDLPWAVPDFNFIGSTMGNFVVPPKNTIVQVYFDHGDIYFPHYSTKVIESSKLSSKRLEDYPDTMILFETDEGDYLTMNRKSGKFVFHHNSGNNLEINRKGDVDILVNGNKEELVKKDETHTVLGDHVIKNGNIAKITIDRIGNVTIEGGIVKIDHTVMLNVTGQSVIPTGVGPLNALPQDPVTGLPHSGNICI